MMKLEEFETLEKEFDRINKKCLFIGLKKDENYKISNGIHYSLKNIRNIIYEIKRLNIKKL